MKKKYRYQADWLAQHPKEAAELAGKFIAVDTNDAIVAGGDTFEGLLDLLKAAPQPVFVFQVPERQLTARERAEKLRKRLLQWNGTIVVCSICKTPALHGVEAHTEGCIARPFEPDPD